MSDARATCPHCQTEQTAPDWSRRACTQCGRTFYPAPSVDPVLLRKRQTRRLLRERDEQAAQRPLDRYWTCCIAGGFLLLVLVAQLGFGAVFHGGKGPPVVILRHEEPARYWKWVAATATGAVTFLGIGIYGLRRVRARLARRFPEDEA
ncbi:hypothetical protein [Tahibacter caeni]|uniref:hypothetical protein n=1 Tax=Tahibacter caeni TaxID=1453545 RepID=UPI00214879EF|nr:hypothetical protein [Tahibacter caeni]